MEVRSQGSEGDIGNKEVAALSNELGKSKLRIDSLEAEFKKLRDEADRYKKELEEKTEALRSQEKFYNELLVKNEEMEKDSETIKEDTRTLASEAKRLEDELSAKDLELSKLKAAFAVLQDEKNDVDSDLESLKRSSSKTIDDLKRQLAESLVKYDKIKSDYDILKAKFDSIIKGGENLDNVTKNYYGGLEKELAEVKENYEQLR